MTCRRDRIRFDQHEKNFTSEALVEALKKLKTFFHFFKTLRLFSRLFHEFKTLCEPCPRVFAENHLLRAHYLGFYTTT